MSIRFMQICAGVLVLAGVIGWSRAGAPAVDVAAAVDPWQDLNPAGVNVAELAQGKERLKLSGLFPVSQQRAKDRAALEAQNSVVNDTGIPPFPTIIAVSTVNGLPQVHLRLAENQNIVAGVGETLASGWTLKMIDLKRVIAVYEGQEHEFKIADYSSQADIEEQAMPENQ